ncbi:MAG: hypothetical protein IMX00_02645 [Limnochordales bacterium]|nr:hypothetical protein [Limnochordales bacterium]
MRQQSKRSQTLLLLLMPFLSAAWWGWRAYTAEAGKRSLVTLLVQALGQQTADLILSDGEVTEASYDLVVDMPGPERVVAASLAPDRGWIIVAAGDSQGSRALTTDEDWMQESRPFLAVSEELGRICRVDSLQAVGDPASELRVIEEYDARTGALSFVRQMRVLKWDGRRLRSVWEGRMWEESYSPEPPFSRKLTLASSIEMRPGVITTVETLSEYERRPDSVQYDLVKETRSTREYRWDANRFYFVAR